MQKTALLIVLIVQSILLCSQSISINNTGAAPDPSAMLDVNVTGGALKGFLLPRMTMSARNSIAMPATGLLIYQTDDSPGLYVNSGTPGSPSWSLLSTLSWSLHGNSGTNPVSHFLGTTDNQPLAFRLNNTAAGELDPILRNYFIGHMSGSVSTGTDNTAMGHSALRENTEGINNTAFGSQALQNSESGDNNSAFGAGALLFNTMGTGNSAVGYIALNSNTEGIYNTAMGQAALTANSTGDLNSAFGAGALATNSSGSENVALGFGAMNTNTTGTSNTAIGASAMHSNSTGSSNVAQGVASLQENETGNSNVAIGPYALNKNIFRSNLVALGDSALFSNGLGATGETNDAIWNTAVGSKALAANTTGSYNTAVGHQSQRLNTIGSSNTSVGNRSLYNNTDGELNTAVGNGALFWNSSGDRNSALGENALGVNTTGSYNTAVGLGALYANTIGNANSALGYGATVAAGDVNNSAAIGSLAYASQSNSIVLGSIAGINNAIANTRVGIGVTAPIGSLDVARGDVSGTSSTAVFRGTENTSNFNYGTDEHTYLRGGKSSSYVILNDIANGRVGVGIPPEGSLDVHRGNAPGGTAVLRGTTYVTNFNYGTDEHTYIHGGKAGSFVLLNPSNSGYVGIGLSVPESSLDVARGTAPGGTAAFRGTSYITNFNYGTDEDTYINGGKAGSDVFINNNGGNVGIGNTNPSEKLTVTGNICYTGTIAACSDVRYKQDFVLINNALQAVLSMHGLYYYWNRDAFPEKAFTQERQIGFSAQEIETFYPEVVQTDNEGYKSVDYGRLTPVLVEAIKTQQHLIEQQAQRITDLSITVQKLLTKIESLEQRARR